MPIPPDPVLRAAVRWLDRLPVSGVARCRSLFATHADFSDITPTQYEAAYTWLRESHLLDDLRSDVPVPRRVFSSAVAESGLPWFRDADVLVQGPEELTDDALRAARSLRLSDQDAFVELASAWGKVDTAERERIGTAGELALVGLLSDSPGVHVEHVAAVSDGYGYDIAVEASRLSVHIEAKSTVRRGRLVVHLSRNEYETMHRDPAWQLVAVCLDTELQPVAILTVPRPWIAEQVPSDRTASGRWESCRLEIPPEVPEPGIATLTPALVAGASQLLTGSAGWPR